MVKLTPSTDKLYKLTPGHLSQNWVWQKYGGIVLCSDWNWTWEIPKRFRTFKLFFFLYFDFRAIIKFCFAQTVFKYFPIIKFAKRQIMNTIAVVASWHCCVQNISTFCYIQKSLGTPLFCSIWQPGARSGRVWLFRDPSSVSGVCMEPNTQ